MLQVSSKLQAAQETMRKMQGVISTDAEAEKCLSGMLERFHRRLSGLVSAAPVSAGDHKARELHVAPRVNEMLEKYPEEVQALCVHPWNVGSHVSSTSFVMTSCRIACLHVPVTVVA